MMDSKKSVDCILCAGGVVEECSPSQHGTTSLHSLTRCKFPTNQMEAMGSKERIRWRHCDDALNF
ncbi:hypothetical protein PsorP6_008050 [Peronosclerospora sorghi]|uniref:Uncharacterized protein n=1 Tax=Peronosclerospora sorghi TaxID=230839 RepID=A0ACC0W868_9STRA|nr:hypothetical protein PsorP6_008050 [Peronosclerospora sorghi]